MAILINVLPDPQLGALGPVEYLELTWDERCKPHSRFTTSGGTEIAVALQRGSQLKDGLAVYNGVDRTIVIKAKHEPVLLIKPADNTHLCMVAHQLGNWHRSLQVKGDSILTLADGPFADWLSKQSIDFEHTQLPFEPNLRSHSHD